MACVDSLRAKIKNGAYPSRRARELVGGPPFGPGYGEFRTDYEPILGRIARSQSHNHSGGGIRTAIVDHGNPGAWHGTSASASATAVACTSDAEVLEGVLDSVVSHELVFARLMALADVLGYM